MKTHEVALTRIQGLFRVAQLTPHTLLHPAGLLSSAARSPGVTSDVVSADPEWLGAACESAAVRQELFSPWRVQRTYVICETNSRAHDAMTANEDEDVHADAVHRLLFHRFGAAGAKTLNPASLYDALYDETEDESLFRRRRVRISKALKHLEGSGRAERGLRCVWRASSDPDDPHSGHGGA